MDADAQRMRCLLFLNVLCMVFLFPLCCPGQTEPPRVADPGFRFQGGEPAYETGRSPLVLIDEGHNNFHTVGGTYKAFASLITGDGYRVALSDEKIIEETLGECRIFVISDAMPLADGTSPFSDAEILTLYAWVKQGGSLLLVTDHFPDPAAVEDLGAAFGITWSNGYVLNGYPDGEEAPLVFRRREGTLGDHPVTNGRGPAERVDSVATFLGCAFRANPRYAPLLILDGHRKSWLPEEPYRFGPDTPRIDVEGWLQGGAATFGKGRVAVFGEAACLTAQLFGDGKIPVGMNHPQARENARFVLNLMHWLSGLT